MAVKLYRIYNWKEDRRGEPFALCDAHAPLLRDRVKEYATLEMIAEKPVWPCDECGRVGGQGRDSAVVRGADLISKAIALAAKAHEGQKDKAGEPYILHCLRVMFAAPGIARVYGPLPQGPDNPPIPDEIYQAAAVLHDVIEDTSIESADLDEAGFPDEVICAVLSLTRRPSKLQPYDSYIAELAGNPIARAVKIADLEDNLDPRRKCPPEEAARLRPRYEKARNYLLSHE